MEDQDISEISIEHAKILADAYNQGGRGRGERMGRIDAEGENVLALALEDMRARVYEDAYPALKSRLFFPVSTDVDAGADTYSIERSDFAGEAKIISEDGHADDLPNVETKRTKEFRPILTLGDSYRWTRSEIMRAAFMGLPLSARKALAARRVYERKFDEVAATGAPDHGLATGLLNDANIDIKPLAAAGAWSTKTPSQILADLNLLVRSVAVDSKEVYEADRILLPTSQWYIVSQTKMSVDSDQTILQAFRAANPTVALADSWRLLAGAGVGSTDRAMSFAATPEAMEIVEPMPFTVLPPESRNLAFVVNCWGKSGGAAIEQPLACAYMDGI